MKRKFVQNYAALAVAWLKTQPPGRQVTTSQVAQALGVKEADAIRNLRRSMRACEAIKGVGFPPGNGAPVGRGSFVAHWWLAQYEPLPLERQTKCAPRIKPRPGQLFPGVYAIGAAA